VSWSRANDARLKQYLLRTLDPGEEARLERQYLAEQPQFERLLVVEDELIDAYVRGELLEPERSHFEAQYLTAAYGREKIDAARVLMQCLTEQPAHSAPAARARVGVVAGLARMSRDFFAALGPVHAGAAAVIGVAVIAVLATVTIRLNRQIHTLQAERAETARQDQQRRVEVADERQRVEQLAAELQQARATSLRMQRSFEMLQRSGSIVTLVLSPGILRDTAAPPRIIKRPETTLVVLALQLADEGYDSYRVTVRAVLGKEVWRQELSKPVPQESTGLLMVSLPAATLTAADYVLTLQGRARNQQFEDVGSYHWQVLKQ
jgi:hypothetical protein